MQWGHTLEIIIKDSTMEQFSIDIIVYSIIGLAIGIAGWYYGHALEHWIKEKRKTKRFIDL